VFIRTLAAYDIAALMDYGGLSLHEACEAVVMENCLRWAVAAA
jgi:beta-aspartyl-peptidase (threonine type)